MVREANEKGEWVIVRRCELCRAGTDLDSRCCKRPATIVTEVMACRWICSANSCYIIARFRESGAADAARWWVGGYKPAMPLLDVEYGTVRLCSAGLDQLSAAERTRFTLEIYKMHAAEQPIVLVSGTWEIL